MVLPLPGSGLLRRQNYSKGVVWGRKPHKVEPAELAGWILLGSFLDTLKTTVPSR